MTPLLEKRRCTLRRGSTEERKTPWERTTIEALQKNMKLKERIKDAFSPAERRKRKAIRRLRRMPRYTPVETDLFDRTFHMVDSRSFLSAYREIFEKGTYRFNASTPTPLMIDCGANIGVSILYLKQQYPGSRMIAFEPDPEIFSVLKKNVETFELTDVELVNKAVWRSEETLTFLKEGADAGKIVDQDEGGILRVPAIRLRDYLQQPVDFLKIDIEGAEVEVLKDCRDSLGNVENIFVEYHSFVGRDQDLAGFIEVLDAAGFRLHIHAPGISRQPLYVRKEYMGMDMQLNIFGYRDGKMTGMK